MKMVKSLLLGTAAGLFAVAGAQAADMPVKAKPVLYVKICTLYGDGFYYIPGTDICLKLGGYVRTQHYWNYGANATQTPFFGGNVANTRIGGQTDWTNRVRALISVDTRQQTEYGTLRTYFTVGHTSDFSPSAASAQAIYANRAFIQFAGFTMGLASSFFDFYSSPIVSYFALNTEDTGDGGWKVFAYTANFGNGVTSTLSVEEPRRMVTLNNSIPDFALINATTFGTAITPLQDQATIRFPDIVWNWRIDQAWGAALIGGAVHDASAGYYAASTATGPSGSLTIPLDAQCSSSPVPDGTFTPTGTITNSTLCGHPADKLGWVVTAGLRLNGLNGSFFQTQASYAEGALKYLSHTQFPTSNAVRFSNNSLFQGSLGYGLSTDGVYGQGGEVELTKGFAVYASYDHVWWAGSKWRTSIYGGWIDVGFNDNAKALIANATCGVNTTAGAVQLMSNCDPDWSIAYIGSRTQYNFTPEFYMGFDVLYTKLSTGFAGTGFFNGIAGVARPRGTYVIEDQDTVSVTFRVHRDFKP